MQFAKVKDRMIAGLIIVPCYLYSANYNKNELKKTPGKGCFLCTFQNFIYHLNCNATLPFTCTILCGIIFITYYLILQESIKETVKITNNEEAFAYFEKKLYAKHPKLREQSEVHIITPLKLLIILRMKKRRNSKRNFVKK